MFIFLSGGDNNGERCANPRISNHLQLLGAMVRKREEFHFNYLSLYFYGFLRGLPFCFPSRPELKYICVVLT